MKEKSLPQKIYKKLKWSIIKGELISNDSINERKFSEKFGISRTPLREALVRLEQDGFVQSFSNRGYIVAPMTFKEVMDLFDVRLCIETFAITQICEYKIPVNFELLRLINEEYLEASNAGDNDTFIQKNVEFHRIIVDSLGNSYIANVHNLIRDKILRLAFASNKLRAVVTMDGFHEHEKFIRDLEGYKLEECIQEIQGHLLKGKTRILEASKGSYAYL